MVPDRTPITRDRLIAAGIICAGWLAIASDRLDPTHQTAVYVFAVIGAAWFAGQSWGFIAAAAILGLKAPSVQGIDGLQSLAVFTAEGVALALLASQARGARRPARAAEPLDTIGSLIAAIPAPLWLHDPATGRILEANEAAARLYDYERQEFLDRTVGDLVRLSGAGDEGDGSGWTVQGRVRAHRTKDGRPIEVELCSGLIDLAGRPARLVLAVDATERLATLRRVEQARDEAEGANRAKEQFLAALGHELRAPMTPALASATALLHDPETPPALRPGLETVRRNVGLAARLMEDLFDLSRIGRGKLRLESQVVDLQALVERALEVSAEEIRAAGLEVERHWGVARPLTMGDPARLEQVFWNVIKNAAKFTPVGGTVRIRTVERRDDLGHRLRVEVSDTGRGIEPDFLPSVFEPFVQGDAGPTRRGGGLGLGLAISRSIVEAHGGRIIASSAGRGRGTTFAIELPALGTTSPEPPAPHPAAEAPPAPHPRAYRLLLVEDHADTRAVLSTLLRRAGHRVTAAEGFAAALEAYRREEFDAVITDVGLPDGSGLDLLPALRAIRPVAGVALSGSGSMDDLGRSREAGFVDHLVKPFDLAALETAVGRAVRAVASQA